jgi:hypothetical protein
MRDESNGVWVFVGVGGGFASAVFSSLETAEACIAANGFTGILTWYPLDETHYDWATRTGVFKPKRDDQKTREFRQGFSSGIASHYHYEDGKR